MASRTWYVNVLAVHEEHRGKGYGARLLTIAEQIASDVPAAGLSIIVSDANTGARRLYERCGFGLVAREPMVNDDWVSEGQNWLLLTKPALPGA